MLYRIALIFILLVGSWHLGQVSSELFETKIQLAAAENTKARLLENLAIQGSELLSLKQELEELSRQFENTQQEEKQTGLRHFNSLDELQAWLAEDDTNQMEYCEEFNCIDFALQLQERALADGYILSTEVLPVAYHWANIAVIGDVYYVIEPQDDRILLEVNICQL